MRCDRGLQLRLGPCNRSCKASTPVALRAPRTMPLPGQVAADPTAEAIGAATPAAVAAAAVVPQPVHAIEVLRTVRAASAAGQAVVAPRVLADADVALRAPAVEVVRVGRAAAARPCNRSCKGESVRGSEGAPHYAAARAGGCRSHGGGDRGRNPTPAAVAAAAVVPQPVHAIEVPRTVRAASAAGQAVVDPRVLADADVALRAPAVEVVRVGRAAAARPCNRSCKGESVRGSEGAPHYAAARAGGCRSHSGGDRGRNAGSGRSSGGGAAAGACDRGPEDGARCVGGGAGNRRSEGTSGRGRGSEGASR